MCNLLQSWNAFDDPIGKMPPASILAPASDNGLQIPLPDPAFGGPFTAQKILEVLLRPL